VASASRFDGAGRLQPKRNQCARRGTAPAVFIGDPAPVPFHVDTGAVDKIESLVRPHKLTASLTYLGRDLPAVCEMPAPFDFPPGKQFCFDARMVTIKLPMRGPLLI
jgi:hypothetical protein